MARKSLPFTVEFASGAKDGSLAKVQDSAIKSIASDMAETIRHLLSDGYLVNDHGRIIPNPERMKLQ